MGTRYRNPEPGTASFVTTTAVDFKNICRNDRCYQIIVEAIKFCLLKYKLKLLAYIIMPNHVHLVILGDGDRISGFMRDFKRASAVRIRREFDLSFPGLKDQFKKGNGERGYKIWMDRFDLVVAFSESVLKTKVKYILMNPVRSKLVEKMQDWPYSSAVNYFNPSKAVLPIEFIRLDLG